MDERETTQLSMDERETTQLSMDERETTQLSMDERRPHRSLRTRCLLVTHRGRVARST
jgi:hypothetical protein